MKIFSKFIIVILFQFIGLILVKGQNVCLDFDNGVAFVQNNAILIGSNDFTTEMWMNMEVSDNNFRRAFSLLGMPGGMGRFELGVQNNQLTLFFQNVTGTSIPVTALPAILTINTWHHLAVTMQNGVLKIYFDCTQVASSDNSGGTFLFSFQQLNITGIRVGEWPGGATPVSSDWVGKVDDVKIWNYGKTSIQIDDGKHCLCGSLDPGILLYWNFDEGDPGNLNAPVVLDKSGNGNDGIIVGLLLNGTTSNFLNSTAPLVYPNLNDLDLLIRDYPYRNNLLTDICIGEPVHIELNDDMGNIPGPFTTVTVDWYSVDPGLPPVPLAAPPFTDFAYGVPSGDINYNCNSPDGYVDRTYYSISTVTNNFGPPDCKYKSSEYVLRICCPIQNATVDITPVDRICEGETVNVQVALNSPDPFINSPSSIVTIKWFYDGNYLGAAFDNITTFPYTVTGPPISGSSISLCFEAQISMQCDNKSANFTNCVVVDVEPVCGAITGYPENSPNNLTLITSSPHLTYEICPNQDASLIEQLADPFQDCIPFWQYSFSQSGPWNDLGQTNTLQNTNIIPTTSWPGSNIFYRVECKPLANPSECDPCYSNLIEIQLKPDFPAPFLLTPVTPPTCKGDNFGLSAGVIGFPGLSYSWFCNGVQVANTSNVNLTANGKACYYAEVSDGCYLKRTADYCIDPCEVIAKISCPLPSNECACEGQDITLSACDSYSTCPNPSLTYEWYVDGIPRQFGLNCQYIHTPNVSGALYEVKVIDTNSGCMGQASKFITPCIK